jgi:hypothetical protein
MKFSQRIGLTPHTKEIQIASMDNDLKNTLWNILREIGLETLSDTDEYGFDTTVVPNYSSLMWHKHFKLQVEYAPKNKRRLIDKLREIYADSQWFERYELIEYIYNSKIKGFDKKLFTQAINKCLENEFAGYRFVNGCFMPITNDLEIKSIEESLEIGKQYTALTGVNLHINTAIDHLSKKPNGDYRNSIKESISAVEAACRIITGKNSLGDALKELENKNIIFDSSLTKGFDKLYAYTNNRSSGIRHANIDPHKDPGFDLAKYMLVSCSAFINLLISSANNAGIKFN